MRLTLRTMLAYMDDILEPEDTELIRKKIEESEFATGLLHRTRDVMRRLRLGTPSVTDRGAGLDPNTVAEYLDHMLADDRVLDFEKVCLESDIHLAEVASCHQILALVLGEPAEVDMASRQRMYQLPGLVDAEIKAATEAAESQVVESAAAARPHASEPGVEPTAGAPRAKPVLPEWIRDEKVKRRNRLLKASIVVVASICVGLALVVIGQSKPDSFLGSLFGIGQPDQSTAQAPELSSQGPSELAGGSRTEPSEPGVSEPQTAQPDLLPADNIAPVPPTEATEPLGTTAQLPPPTIPEDIAGWTEPEPAGEVVIQDDGEPAGLDQRMSVEPHPMTEPGEDALRPIPPTEPGPSEVVGSEAGAATPAGPAASPLAQPSVADVTVTIRDTPGPRAREPEARPPIAAAPLPPEPVGQLDSPTQVLLMLDADTDTWQRLADQTQLFSQTSYLSLTSYRPMLRLVDQTQLRLIDGTRIELLPVDQDGVTGLVVKYGRLVIETPEKAGSRLRLEIGDRSGMITLEDAGSRLAIEVGRTPVPKSDPETQPGPLTADLYATSGRILWQERGGREPVAVNAPVRLTLNDQPLEALAVQQFPNWIVADTISLLDQRASGMIERELEVGRPAELGLRELADDRRTEVRWLALRCLDCIGDFELMVAALDDPEQNMAWPDYVERLRAAVVRNPRAAAQVRTAMEKLHGGEGASLYEMLWKYGDTLDSREAASLVRYLNHDTLAFRVVSFQTLKRITKLGLKYRPEDTAAKRRPWVEKWEERLKSSAGLWAEMQGDQQPPPEDDDS